MTATTQVVLEVARFVVAVVAGMVGGLISHHLTLRRERQNRKREFCSFVVKLKAECKQHPHPREFALFYGDKLGELGSVATSIEADFRGERRAEFKRLVDAAAEQDSPSRVIAALNAILDFLK